MVDTRGRLLVSFSKSQIRVLNEIIAVTDKKESEVLLDALNFMYHEMVRTGQIPTQVDNDVVVSMSRKIAILLGNTSDQTGDGDVSTSVNTGGQIATI